jgi:FixJ family two-component response regulator
MQKARTDSIHVTAMHPPIKVAVIENYAPTRKALERLVQSAGMEAAPFSSARQFLDALVHQQVDCAVSDVEMPGFDGLRLQKELNKTLPHLSMVFITGRGNVAMSVEAMKCGAVDVLEKPIDEEALLTAIYHAAERSRALKTAHDELSIIERRYERMTPRERQVFALVTTGFLNKQIASELGVSERTVKLYRARATEVMKADSFPQLVHMAQRLGISA